jgi:hypothetical protein
MCHLPGGAGSPFDFTNYASVFAHRTAMLDQVHACNMPPKSGAPLEASERQTLLTGLVCGAPDS